MDGDALTFSVVQQPTNGTLVVTATNAIYFPGTNFHGGDSFTYVANDGTTNSVEAIVSIAVISVNDIPRVDAGPGQLISLPRNSVALIGLVSDDDFDGASLVTQWSVVFGAGAVSFSDSGTNADTVATVGTNGVYTLRLTADDGFLSDFDDVVITVNAPPFVNAGSNQLVNLPEAVLNGVASDDNLPTNQFTVAWSASGPGTVIFSNPTGTNTAASFSASGLYTLQLVANDSAARSTNIVLVLANRAPTVDAGSTQTIATLETTLAASVNDDGFPSNTLALTWSKVSGPGDVTFATPNATNTAVSFATNGTYILRLTADDLAAQSSGDVIIRINGLPEALPQNINVDEDTSANLTLQGQDADGDTLIYIRESEPLHGTLTGTGASLTYTPAANYFGPDSFAFKVSDGGATSAVAMVSIVVLPVNDAPVAHSITTNIDEDTALALTRGAKHSRVGRRDLGAHGHPRSRTARFIGRASRTKTVRCAGSREDQATNSCWR